MKRCPSCGQTTNDDSQQFCTRCGAYYVTRPAGQAQPVSMDLPSDPVERGIALADIGDLSGAAESWRAVVTVDRSVGDDEYRRIVSSIAGAMLGMVVQPSTYTAMGMPSLALSFPDRDLITDVMRVMGDSLSICSIQNGVLGIANPYMYMFVDTFSVYTDVRELRDISETVNSDLSAMIDRASDLPNAYQGKGADPMTWLESYGDFASVILGVLDHMVSSVSESEMEELAGRWRTAGSLPYVQNIHAAFVLSTRATLAGKLTSKMLIKTRDKQVDVFKKTYMAGPKR